MKYKLFNRALVALLTFMLIVGLIPTTVCAADVASVQINGQKLQNNVPLQCGDGTAVLDEEKKTLTLDNVTINQETSAPLLRIDNGDLKIILIGENTITSTNQRPIYAGTVNLTIQGTQADSLTVTTDADAIQLDRGNLTIDSCNIDIISTNWGGLYCYGILTIKNGANITVNCHNIALSGEKGLNITESTVNLTSKGYYSDNGNGSNVINSMDGDISIDNSTVKATATSNKAYPTIYADGDINVTNNSHVEALSDGMRGIYTESNMTVADSTVTATGTTDEGMIVIGTLSLTDSKLTAFGSSKNDAAAIKTKQLQVTASELTANGGVYLFATYGDSENISFSITPTNEKLAELKVDSDNWDGSTAKHFKEKNTSPYNTAVNFSADEISVLNTYHYIHIGEHIHTGGIATCEIPAICEDCGQEYGSALGHGETELINVKEATCTEEGYTGDKICKVCGKVLEKGETIAKIAHNFKDGKCTVCNAADPDYKTETISPQTGDNSSITLWMILLFISGSGLFGASAYNNKQKYDK